MSDRLIGIPVDVLATPREGEVLVDRWWVTRDGLALFWSIGGRGWSPQCNSDRRLPDKLVARYEPAEVIHMPLAFLGSWHPDFGYELRELREHAVVLE